MELLIGVHRENEVVTLGVIWVGLTLSMWRMNKG